MSTIPETPKPLCLCIDCNRPMRPRGVLLKEMPGTMAWGHSGKCKSCVQPNGPTDRNKTPRQPAKPVVTAETAPPLPNGRKDVHLEHTIAGLNSFMAARERRLRIQASKAVAQSPLRRTA
ncbi:hypothetical protein GCM10023063_18480 [Arthrobacter methylotrophus]|uniref:Uncharacterized protein n=1 Tax=Arthrobacter methylotrophus TaxID=121291 RepID=A0ABV5UP05_9MICC